MISLRPIIVGALFALASSAADAASPICDHQTDEEYCIALKIAREPMSLTPTDTPSPGSMRLIWLRSFHAPVVVRVDMDSASRGQLRVATLSSPHLEPGTHITLDKKVHLSSRDIGAILAVLDKEDFWGQNHEIRCAWGFPPPPPNPNGEIIVQSDGAFWVVEGLRASRYQALGDCGLEGPVTRIGLAMLNLAHHKVPAFDARPVY